MSVRPLKVMVLGVRGIPSVQGGVETHAEQLYERLSHMDCDVEVLVRTPFVPPYTNLIRLDPPAADLVTQIHGL